MYCCDWRAQVVLSLEQAEVTPDDVLTYQAPTEGEADALMPDSVCWISHHTPSSHTAQDHAGSSSPATTAEPSHSSYLHTGLAHSYYV